MIDSRLDVYVGEKKVGELVQENYEYSFRYIEPTALDVTRDFVSLTMPVRAKSYDTQVLMPPFQMALPEGALLENIRHRFGKLIDVSNDINLLKLVGGNVIGRVRFVDPSEKLSERSGDSEQPQYTLKALLKYPKTQALFSDLLEHYALASGVSGVQPKVLWRPQNEKVAIALKDYIVKSSGREFPGLAVNEYFCLRLAQACGLTTPNFHLSDSQELLVVERFDYDEKHVPLGFEEMCGLLHLPNHGKYSKAYEDIALAIRQIPCEPLNHAQKQFFKAVVLCMVIRNGDAHLKNFGVLYRNANKKWLAPIYDLVTTTVYMPNDVPALTLGGEKAWPDCDALIQFGLQACELRRRAINQIFDDIRFAVKKVTPQLKKFASKNTDHKELCERMAVQWKMGVKDLS